jgi:predicted nucleic acid-binding protein
MSDGAQKPIYSVDTNVLMDWQARYFPTDVFGSLVTSVDVLVNEGRWLAPEIVEEELSAVGTAETIAWAKARPSVFVPLQDVLAEALSIQNRFPGLKDPKSEFEEADAYVIALAKLRNGIVVTQETPAAEKNRPRRTHFIPDVCRELGIPCISLLGLMRREGWKF